jgi:uncharacterized membrane protein
MAFCSKCGTEVGAGTAFCPKCGSAQGGAAAQTGGAVIEPVPSSQSGLAENVAATLCYVLGWVTGIIFYLIDKRPFVRFHAAQSIVTFGGLHVVNIVLGIIFGAGLMFRGGFGTFGIASAFYGLIGLLTFVLWILLMVKAYQHEKFEVPVAGGIAKGFSGT